MAEINNYNEDELLRGGDEGVADPTKTKPGSSVPATAPSKRILDGDKEAGFAREQLEARIDELEKELKKEKSKAKKKDGDKTKEIENYRLAVELVCNQSIRGQDSLAARDSRVTKDGDQHRTDIDVSHILHPDHECASCGPRIAGSIMPAKDLGFLKDLEFATLRQLGALIDACGKDKEMGQSKGRKYMREKSKSKEVSIAALKKAYEYGNCAHSAQAEMEVESTGVNIDGDSTEISDALTEVLSSSCRVSRMPYLVIYPGDSVISKLKGKWKNMEEMIYDKIDDIAAHISTIKEALPKNLIIFLKNDLEKDNLDRLKNYLLALADKNDIVVYVGCDILPEKPTPEEVTRVEDNLVWTSNWRLQPKPRKNVVIMSAFSATLWSHIPFINIFTFARKESKDLLEKAIMHIVDGQALPFPETEKKPGFVSVKPTIVKSAQPTHGTKRSHIGGPNENRPPLKSTRREVRCYRCKSADHVLNRCPQPTPPKWDKNSE